MVGILKKGVHDPSCFRRTRSANSVNISNEVHIITASSGPDTSQPEEQTASYEPVPQQTNSVKGKSPSLSLLHMRRKGLIGDTGRPEQIVEEEFTSEINVDPSHDLQSHNGPDDEVVTSREYSSQQLPPNNGPVLQRSLSDNSLELPNVDLQPKTEGEEEEDNSTPTATSFPSLPDTVLKTMALYCSAISADSERESLTEDDIENRFTSLSLAFKTDKLTLSNRLELQQRQRDQAECNMAAEVDRLKTAIYKLNRVYVDSESVENLTQIQALVDILQQATDRVSSSAEMFGAVQQEHRLSIATEVLVTHVENVKRSLEKMSIELEEVKRVLAENNIIMEESTDLTDEPAPRTHRYRSLAGIVTSSKKISSKRRASIAVLPRPLSSPETTRSVTSPSITTMEPRSRMANVVNAIRRKTSLSSNVSHMSVGLDINERAEQVPGTVEEIEEASELQNENVIDKIINSSYDEVFKVRPNEENGSTSFLSSDSNFIPIEEISSAQDFCQDKPTCTQADTSQALLQRVMNHLKRIFTQARLNIKEFDHNHRVTLLEKLRFYVAVMLVAAAAWFLLWIGFFPAEGSPRRYITWHTVEELLRPYIKYRHREPPPT